MNFQYYLLEDDFPWRAFTPVITFSDGLYRRLQYSLSIGVSEGHILCVCWSYVWVRGRVGLGLSYWGVLTVSLNVNESIGQIAVGAKMWLLPVGWGQREGDTCIQWLKPQIILLWICANLRMTLWSSVACGLWCITLALQWNENERVGYG